MIDTNPPAAGRSAVLVEDDEGVRRSLQLLLHWRGYVVTSFASAAPALACAGADSADLVVVDYRLPHGTGLDVVEALKRRGWAGRSILIT